MPPYLLYNYAPKNSVGNREIIDFMVIISLRFVEHFLGHTVHPMYSLLKETFSNKHQKTLENQKLSELACMNLIISYTRAFQLESTAGRTPVSQVLRRAA